ncbi:MAG: class I SAM-dependent methyltransferase [Vicinamibacterales bacterium]|nr:class I SAM-dependent methyltransferase [Vicinamibacterales bacterium]
MTSVSLRRPLHDLGTLDVRLSGILSPGYSDADLDRHIHDLFKGDCAAYMRPFPLSRQGIEHWKTLIQDALSASHVDYEGRLAILDIGSGEGTSVFPLMELFPNAEIIASDLSTNLLLELRRWQNEHYANHKQLVVLQLNAEDTVFEDRQIDIVTGAFILHHMGDVAKTLIEVHRVLKPGGVAVFWEGFESGCQVVSLVMQLLIAKNDTMPAPKRISPDVITGFREFMADLHRRSDASKSQALLDTLDDKWIFTKTQLERVAAAARLEVVAIRSVHSPDGLISTMMNHELRRKLQSLSTLPHWAGELVSEIEGQFSRDLKSEILYGGVMILSKAR